MLRTLLVGLFALLTAGSVFAQSPPFSETRTPLERSRTCVDLAKFLQREHGVSRSRSNQEIGRFNSPIECGSELRLLRSQKFGTKFPELRNAIASHNGFLECFRSKLLTGFCRVGAPDSNRYSFPRDSETSKQISSFFKDEKTAGLLYFENADGSLSVFLLDKRGLGDLREKQFGSIDSNHVLIQSHGHDRYDARRALDGVRSELNISARSMSIFPADSFLESILETDGQTRTSSDTETTRGEPSLSVLSLDRLSEILLPPEIGAEIEKQGYDRLVILPSKSTSNVPFSALRLPSGQQVVDAASIVILPDISSFGLNLDSSGRGYEELPKAFQFQLTQDLINSRNTLIVGDPTYAPYKGIIPAPLPGARREAKQIAGALNVSNILVGDEATYNNVMGSLKEIADGARLIYFATHGISDSENPMHGSLVALAGEHLYAREIRDLKLGASGPLVVLSACQTGLGKQFGGGTFGLLRAWHHAGAGQVAGSLWNVDDTGTYLLMTEFMSELKSGETRPEEALRTAMLRTRARYPDDPAIWASFYIFGTPAS